MFQHGWKSFFLYDIILKYNFSIHVKMSKKFNCKKKSAMQCELKIAKF